MDSETPRDSRIPSAEYLALLHHEYDALRQEIVAKMDAHHRMFSWAVVLITGAGYLGFTNWAAEPGHADLVSELSFAVLLPLIAMSFYFAHQLSSAQATRVGDYLFWLEMKAAMIVGGDPAVTGTSMEAFGARFRPLATQDESQPVEDMKKYLSWPMGWEHWIRRKSWGMPRQGSLGWDGKHWSVQLGHDRTVTFPWGAVGAGILSCGLGIF